jgi:hypothetical protein
MGRHGDEVLHVSASDPGFVAHRLVFLWSLPSLLRLTPSRRTRAELSISGRWYHGVGVDVVDRPACHPWERLVAEG